LLSRVVVEGVVVIILVVAAVLEVSELVLVCL
jgi:hypothetical protein